MKKVIRSVKASPSAGRKQAPVKTLREIEEDFESNTGYDPEDDGVIAGAEVKAAASNTRRGSSASNNENKGRMLAA